VSAEGSPSRPAAVNNREQAPCAPFRTPGEWAAAGLAAKAALYLRVSNARQPKATRRSPTGGGRSPPIAAPRIVGPTAPRGPK
jgi:hypothetical protein